MRRQLVWLGALTVICVACAGKAPPKAASSGPTADRAQAPCGGSASPMALPRDCKVDRDCIVAAHVTDCCGSVLVVGIRASEKVHFESAERLCSPQGGACECLAKPAVTESGKPVRELPEAWASCLAGRCTAFAP